MIGRIFAVAMGLFSAIAASQTPEFAQQYRQRLGGAIDELRRVVATFDENARAEGLSRDQAIERLAKDPDPLVRRQATATEEVVARLARLERQREDFAQAGPFRRVLIFIREGDPGLVRATYLDYEPAVPTTTEGAVTAGAGFLAGWGIILFLARMFARLSPWRRRRGRVLRSA